MGQRLRFSAIAILLCCIVSCALGTEVDSSTVQRRLIEIEKSIPLPYHPSLLNDIKNYQSKKLPANYPEYETVIKEAIQKKNMPEELVYLPLALTNMNLNYHRDHRAGVWALPELVAIRYGLTIDETHDERCSIQAATLASLNYLQDLYDNYGDWWQSILAYSNSPAAITKATLLDSGLDPSNPWEYYDQHRLPEVNIIGNFIACYYVYSSDDISIAPTTEQQQHVNSTIDNNKEKIKTRKEPKYITYTVKRGDSLGKIAQRYHVKTNDIKKWNKLKGDVIREKQKLKIYQ